MKIKRKILAYSLMALLALTACDKTDKSEPVTEIKAEDIENRQGVDVENVTLTHAPSRQNFAGYVIPKKAVTVCPIVEGVVKELMIKQGDWVKQNTPLYRLDKQPYLDKIKESKTLLKELQASLSALTNSEKESKTKLEKHKLTLKQAQKQAKRYKLLVKEGAVSEQAYQQAMNEVNTIQVLIEDSKVSSLKALSDMEMIKARVQVTEEQLKLDKQALKSTQITTPMAGIVLNNPLQKGQAITSQVDTCINIAKLDPIFIDIPVTTDEFFALKEHYAKIKKQGKKKQKPAVQLLLNDGKIYADSINFVFDETQITQDNRIILRVLFANKNNKLFPNMEVKAQIDMPNNETDGVALLPLEAIHYLNIPVKEVLKPLPSPEVEPYKEEKQASKVIKKENSSEIGAETLPEIEQVQVTQNSKPFVYLVDNKTNSLKRQFISIKNISSNNQVIVNEGLKNGDKVVLNSDGTLEEGVKVKINAAKNYLKKEAKKQSSG
ncbi:MAG: biotin/lipoyl-binding protein [Moraxellaceae bacterium]|nr:biotin/lipoyl-binding protein [Moraxellaceae bacterium]